MKKRSRRLVLEQVLLARARDQHERMTRDRAHGRIDYAKVNLVVADALVQDDLENVPHFGVVDGC